MFPKEVKSYPYAQLLGEDVFPRLFIADTTSSVPLHISRYAHVVKFEVSSSCIYVTAYTTSHLINYHSLGKSLV